VPAGVIEGAILAANNGKLLYHTGYLLWVTAARTKTRATRKTSASKAAAPHVDPRQDLRRHITAPTSAGGLGLTSLAAFYATGEPDTSDDVAYWARRCTETFGPGIYPTAYQVLTEQHDALLAARLQQTNPTARTSHYAPDTCPGYRPAGSGPEHSCQSPTTCTTPQWWEDHCHIYPLVVEYCTAYQELESGRLAAYAKAVNTLADAAANIDHTWTTYTPGEPLTRPQHHMIVDHFMRARRSRTNPSPLPRAWATYTPGTPLNRTQYRHILTARDAHNTNTNHWATYTPGAPLSPAQARDVAAHLHAVHTLGVHAHWATYTPGTPLTRTQRDDVRTYRATLPTVEFHHDWVTHRRGAPLTRGQVRDIAAALSTKKHPVTAQHVRSLEKNYRALVQRRSVLYPTLAAYYARMENECVMRFRNAVTRIEDIRDYTTQALFQCLNTYRPDKAVPIQAYIRANLAGRVVDRLRAEGIYTRSENALQSALRNVVTDWSPGDPVDAELLTTLARAMKTTTASVERTLAAYTHKMMLQHIEATFDSDEDGDQLQVRAGETFEVEYQMDAAITAVDTRDALTYTLTGVDEDTRELLHVWAACGGEKDDPVLRAYSERTGLTVNQIRKRATEVQDALRAATLERLSECGCGDIGEHVARVHAARSIVDRTLAGLNADERRRAHALLNTTTTGVDDQVMLHAMFARAVATANNTDSSDTSDRAWTTSLLLDHYRDPGIQPAAAAGDRAA